VIVRVDLRVGSGRSWCEATKLSASKHGAHI